MGCNRTWVLLIALVVGAIGAPATGVAFEASDSTTTLVDSVRVLEIAPVTGGDVEQEERERLKESLQRMGRSEVEGRRRWERKKSGRVSLLSSMVLPGLGQVYNGRRVKVAVAAGLAMGYGSQIWLNVKGAQRARARRDRLDPGTTGYNFQNRLIDFHKEEARTWGWWTGAIWILGLLDAWTDAHLYDIRAYTPPANDEPAGFSQVLPTESPTSYLTWSLEF
jgi:hypothetical protein